MATWTNNAPNLDAMSAADLWEFWNKHQHGRHVRELFPERPPGAHKAVTDLANYAANKASAIPARLKGDILTAQIYEDICDRIYDTLPVWARW